MYTNKISKYGYLLLTLLFLGLNFSCSEDDPDLDDMVDPLAPITLTYSASPIDLMGEQADFVADLPYGPHERNVLDIFLANTSEPTPLVIYIHGGGFTQGDKSFAYDSAEAARIRRFLAEGISYVTINYRLLESGETEGVIKSLKDAKRALQFLRAYADDLNVDKDQIVCYGVSAGAGASLWLGLNDDLADLQSTDPVLRESTRIKAAGAIETQATYDIVRWETDIFADFGITLELAAFFGLDQALLQFYGVNDLQDLYTPDIITYRQEVDMLALMDSGDPEIFINNYIQTADAPLDGNHLLHHPFHARELIEQADLVGLSHVSYVPALSIEDPSGEDIVDFVLRKIQ